MSTHARQQRINRANQPIDSYTDPAARRLHSRPVAVVLLVAGSLVLVACGWFRRASDFETPSLSDSAIRGAPLVAFQGKTSGAMPKTNAPRSAITGSPRLTRSPYIQWTTTSSAHILWNTDTPSSSVVDYSLVAPASPRMSTHAPTLQGATGMQRKSRPVLKSGLRASPRFGYGATGRATTTQLVSRHFVKLQGLRASSTYVYRVQSNGRTLFRGRFQTDKRPGEAARIALWGDSGVGDQWQFRVAQSIEKARPDCLVHTGDLIYPRGAERDFDPHFFRPYARLLSRVPFYGSLGNHDVGTKNGAPFLANFVFPPNGPATLPRERNYSFDYAGAHFVVLDSNQSERQLRNVVVPWLRRDLGASRATWKFAVFHHPPFSSGEHGDEIRTQRALHSALSRLNVDIVFNGHDHGYERWKPRGVVVYIVSAAGGANLYKRRRNDSMTAAYNNKIHSWTQLDVRGNVLHGKQIGLGGRVIDSWTMSKR